MRQAFDLPPLFEFFTKKVSSSFDTQVKVFLLSTMRNYETDHSKFIGTNINTKVSSIRAFLLTDTADAIITTKMTDAIEFNLVPKPKFKINNLELNTIIDLKMHIDAFEKDLSVEHLIFLKQHQIIHEYMIKKLSGKYIYICIKV